MLINESTTTGLKIANNSSVVPENIFKKLLENCFTVLSGRNEIHSIGGLYNSKPDVIKELYACLLTATAQFVRNNQSKLNVQEFLQNVCNFSRARWSIYADMYEKFQTNIEISLLNVGNHLPHLVDVNWKIDYIIKASSLNENDGPLFRISLISEKYDNKENCKKVEHINFTCDSQELQDLVYKLKDALRHCQKIANEH